jgi:hypothetical protein
MLLMIASWVLFAVLAVVAYWPERQAAGSLVPAESERTTAKDGGGALDLARRLARRGRPTELALLLALLSLPIVALTLSATTADSYLLDEAVPAATLGQWSAAASAVFISAFVAGTLGAPAVRRHAKAGGLFTFLLALLVAIPALPLLPALLGQSVGAGGVCYWCSSATNTKNLLDGLGYDLVFIFAPLVEPVPVLTLAIGVAVWTYLVRQSPKA